MACAQHGYEDPSSTDKGAAEGTDEVDLQVLRLTRQGVRLNVHRSMFGYDLCKLVSEKLPRKPGAKLTVHHKNRKLTKGLLENRQCCPALTYQQICTLHGAMSVGSRLVRQILC